MQTERHRAWTAARLLAGLSLVLLIGCGPRTPELMNLRSDKRGPDEFGILPAKPLQLPEDLATLPPPTPGGANITDPTPEADAIAALGGNPAVLTRAPTGDGAILAHATRFGVTDGIRTQLASEDLEFRRQNDGRLLERLLNVSVYYKAYRSMSLDQHAELARWRALGLRTNSAPPDPEAR